MQSFSSPFHPPSTVTAYTASGPVSLLPHGDTYSAGDIALSARPAHGGLRIAIAADSTPLERIHLRWPFSFSSGTRFLGDAWERGYGDLEWRGMLPERILPWYFLAYDGEVTHACGVKTQPGALCFWMVDERGISLWLDVRCGGLGVELRGRELHAATIITRGGMPGETPFSAARAFCRLLCDQPRLPSQPVYGSNNWYYAYGISSQEAILSDTRLLVSLAPTADNRPYMVIDAGWQPHSGNENASNIICGGPYREIAYTPRFPDMPALAAAIHDLGARPGVWIRPLAAYPDDPDNMLLPITRAIDSSAKIKVMDPSIPEVIERVRADFRLLHDWGYDLIKHDWSACDLFGRWGFQMGAQVTTPGWRFNDPTRTTAEITLALFQAIREGSVDSIIIGCNTVGHIAAGLFELNRTGDDTSGREWERSRKYGINTLAFRAAQHGAFFAADPDCVGHTRAMPWEQNGQLLDLFARSGAPLFVSIDPAVAGPVETQAVRAAYTAASQPQPVAEPLDWLDTTCPSHWKLNNETKQFNWFGEGGVTPLAKSVPMWWG